MDEDKILNGWNKWWDRSSGVGGENLNELFKINNMEELHLENTKYTRRTPIILDKNTVALIHIFEKYDNLEDTWVVDTDWMLTQDWDTSAEQFVNQLEEHVCDAFIESLILKLIKLYKDSRTKCGCEKDYTDLLNKINAIK